MRLLGVIQRISLFELYSLVKAMRCAEINDLVIHSTCVYTTIVQCYTVCNSLQWFSLLSSERNDINNKL